MKNHCFGEARTARLNTDGSNSSTGSAVLSGFGPVGGVGLMSAPNGGGTGGSAGPGGAGRRSGGGGTAGSGGAGAGGAARPAHAGPFAKIAPFRLRQSARPG